MLLLWSPAAASVFNKEAAGFILQNKKT